MTWTNRPLTCHCLTWWLQTRSFLKWWDKNSWKRSTRWLFVRHCYLYPSVTLITVTVSFDTIRICFFVFFFLLCLSANTNGCDKARQNKSRFIPVQAFLELLMDSFGLGERFVHVAVGILDYSKVPFRHQWVSTEGKSEKPTLRPTKQENRKPPTTWKVTLSAQWALY